MSLEVSLSLVLSLSHSLYLSFSLHFPFTPLSLSLPLSRTFPFSLSFSSTTALPYVCSTRRWLCKVCCVSAFRSASRCVIRVFAVYVLSMIYSCTYVHTYRPIETCSSLCLFVCIYMCLYLYRRLSVASWQITCVHYTGYAQRCFTKLSLGILYSVCARAHIPLLLLLLHFHLHLLPFQLSPTHRFNLNTQRGCHGTPRAIFPLNHASIRFLKSPKRSNAI